MRTFILLLSLAFALSVTNTLRAVDDPGAAQDAQEAREKLLKATDQIQMIQNNSEATKASVDGLKTDLASLHESLSKLQTDNADLHQQVTALKTALEKSEAARVKEKQVLLDSIAEMMASNKTATSGKTSSKKKEKETAAAASETKTTESTTPKASAGADKDESSATTASSGTNADAHPAPVKTQKGYYHIVAGGETLTLICAAYRSEGVNVSVADIQKANGLTDKSILKVGQKLFIPKPGT